jgi:hypothetical protein
MLSFAYPGGGIHQLPLFAPTLCDAATEFRRIAAGQSRSVGSELDRAGRAVKPSAATSYRT